MHPAGDRLLAMTFDPATMSYHARLACPQPGPAAAAARRLTCGQAMSTLDVALMPRPRETPRPAAERAPEVPAEVAAMERGLPADVHVRPVDGGGVVVYLGESPETLVPSLEPRPDGGRTVIVDSSVTSRAVVRQVLENLPEGWLAGPVDVRLAGRADGTATDPGRDRADRSTGCSTGSTGSSRWCCPRMRRRTRSRRRQPPGSVSCPRWRGPRGRGSSRWSR